MKRETTLAALLALLACAPLCRGQYINASFHVGSRPDGRGGGYCGWASTETLATWAGYPQGRGLMAERVAMGGRGSSLPPDWGRAMRARGIPYRVYPPGSFPRVHPAVVGIRLPDGRGHAVIMQGRTAHCQYIYDPNHPGETRCVPPAQFRRQWVGNALVIPPRRR